MKHSWIKWYPVQWLHSTARDEMNTEQRATFNDFVCLAALSQNPGQFKFVNNNSLARQLNTNSDVIESTMKICIEKKRIEIFQDEEGYICKICKWHIYQSIKQDKDECVNNNDENKEKKLTLNDTREDKNREDEIKIDKNKYTEDFEKFWKEYPRKEEKKDAFITWGQLTKKQKEEVLIAVKNYRAKCKYKKTENDFIKLPKTFLNKKAERWKDFLNDFVSPEDKKKQEQEAWAKGELKFKRGF